MHEVKFGKDNVTLKHIPTRNYMCMEGSLDPEDPYGEAKLETLHYTMAKSDDQDEFVTEVLLPVACDSEEFNYLER